MTVIAPFGVARNHRGIVIPPLARACWIELLPGIATLALVALIALDATSDQANGVYVVAATVTAFAGAGVTLVLGLRYASAWDAVCWSVLQEPPRGSGQQANAQQLALALRALWWGRLKEARSSLAEIDQPDAWVGFMALFLAGEIDVAQRRTPDIDPLRQAQLTLDGPGRHIGEVMIATLEAGSEWLAGRDWRAPLGACRETLAIRPSLWRGLWPVRRTLAAPFLIAVIPWLFWLRI